MTSSELWKAIREQAILWSETPVFKRFGSPLPRNVSEKSRGLSGALQSYEAVGARIGAGPLRCSSAIQLHRAGTLGFPEKTNVLVQGWLKDAQRVEAAHRETIAWLRSRLPGYPTIPVPQLCRDTPLTTQEFTWRLVWNRADLSDGVQFRAVPTRTAALLEASRDQEKLLNQALRTVCSAFEATDEWLQFATLFEQLDGDSMKQLRAARTELHEKLKPEKIDAHEENLALPRHVYRQESLTQVIEGLSGSALEYVQAFESIDTLIEVAASHVFGQLSTYGNPKRLAHIRDIDFEPGTPPRVQFNVEDDTFPQVGMLAWAEDDLLVDALQVEETSFSFDQGNAAELRFSALILKNSGTAWRAAS